MKVAHLNKIQKPDISRSPITAWIKNVKLLESEEDFETAISEYKAMANAHPLREEPYNRLMIIYRKEKKYAEEKKLIEEAIKIFKSRYSDQEKKHPNKKVQSLSKSLSRSLGLTDRKGAIAYHSGPTESWEKRAAVLKKLMARSAKG